MIKLTQRQCDIINAYAFNNMTLDGAANELGCHRNTIFYHLSVINKKTGLDPRDFFDLHELFVIAGGNDNADEKTTVSS